MRLDAGDITQAERGDLGTQPGVAAVAGIHQHDTRRNTSGPRGADLVQRDVGLAGKTSRFRHPGPGLARSIGRPFQRQIQPVGDRQAGRVVGNRQGDRHLAIVLLAELAAILPRYPDRMPALLRKPGVVDDPRLDRPVAFKCRQHQFAHPGQNPLVRPRRVADEMQQRLVLRRHPGGRRQRRHRLDALALSRHQQPEAVIPQRRRPVSMADHLNKPLDINRKARFTPISSQVVHHNPDAPEISLAHHILTTQTPIPTTSATF